MSVIIYLLAGVGILSLVVTISVIVQFGILAVRDAIASIRGHR